VLLQVRTFLSASQLLRDVPEAGSVPGVPHRGLLRPALRDVHLLPDGLPLRREASCLLQSMRQLLQHLLQ
jgi:hypothetical protein